MYTLITVFIVIASVLLVLVVLAQNPKDGGLSSAFGGSNQVLGVRKTTNFLEKASWTLAISLVVLSFLATLAMPSATTDAPKSAIESKLQETAPTGTPDFSTLPVETQPVDTAK